MDNSTVVNVNKICGRYDNYEVAIGFFGLGIFIVVVFILFIFYNLFIFYDLKCCRKPSVKPPNPKPPVYDQEFRAIHKPELDQEFRANPYEPPYKPNDKYADIQVV